MIVSFLCLCFTVLFSIKTSAQTLYDDVQTLTESLEILQQDTLSNQPEILAEAAANVLAILDVYDRPLLEKGKRVDEQRLIADYQNNTELSGLIDLEELQFSDTLWLLIQEKVAAKQRQIQGGQRQQMLNILKSDTPVSPVDYLAIPQTIEKYALPPLTQEQQLTQVSEGVNQNVSNGLLTSQAAVIEGLFKFILNRAKDEVLINYLDKLLNEDTPRFQRLFPTVVTEFGQQDFTYSESFLRRLRNAFYEDIQKFSVRLPLLMLTDDYFKKLQSEPVMYNFLVIYSMFGLAQRDYGMEEILPLTHRYLYDSYEEAVKRVNVELVEKGAASADYMQLVTESEQLITQLKQIYVEFNDAEFEIDEITEEVELDFDVDDYPLASDYLKEEKNNVATILGINSESPFSLNLLPQLVAGAFDVEQLKSYNSLADFDRFFSKNYSADELRAAGLELVEKLDGTWYNEQTLTDLLTDWLDALQRYRDDVDAWRIQVDTEGTFAAEVAAVETQRTDLQAAILANKTFWQDSISQQRQLAFSVLAQVVNEAAFANIENINSSRNTIDSFNLDLANLRDKRNLLNAVETRLFKLDNELYTAFENTLVDSPAREYLASKKVESSYNYLRPKIAAFATQVTKLQSIKRDLENQFAPLDRRKRDNAKPVLQMTEATTYLLYNLRNNQNEKDNKWLEVSTLDSVLNNPIQRPMFLGLLQQQLSSVQDLGAFNPSALAQFTDLTLREIPTLPALEIADSLNLRDSMLFYRRATFVVNTLNRIIQLPLISKAENSDNIQPMVERYPQLQRIPVVSEQAL
ncbi:MAG: hypothetical protein AB8G22_26035, partial [Saprospiraceae bacterium]